MKSAKNSNTDWILCPSKSIPGKFYYFNVTTGESVWTDDSNGNKRKKDENIHKLTDNYHIYPEPVNLSEEMQNQQNQPKLNKPSPSNGQVMFPHSHPPMPAIMVTPIQMPLLTTHRENKQMLDQYTQTSAFHDIIIETCNISLSERFAMLGCNSDLESTKHKIDISNPLHLVNYLHKSTLVSNDNYKYMKQLCPPKIMSPILKEPKFESPLMKLKKDNILNNNMESVNSFQPKKHIKESVDKEKDLIQKLNRTDLRHLLVLKRQKSIDFSVSGGHEKAKDNDIVQNVPVKKKYTFNLDKLDDTSDVSVTDDDNEIKQSMHIHLLRNLNEAQNLKDNWYIITDTDVLLDDIHFIKTYINGDDRCKLLVLKSVLKVIERSSQGVCICPQVLAAKHTYIHVVNYKKVEIIDMGKNMTFNDQIINCCLQGISEEKHIVLITKNNMLLERAKAFQIHAYYVDDIKYYNSGERFHTKSSKSEKIVDIKKNTFLQTEEDNASIFNQSSNIHDNIDSQIEIFNDNVSNNNNYNDKILNKKQDGKEDLIICREISNVNCIQKNDISISKKVSRVINSTYINRKIENTTNDEDFQKIFSNCDNIFDKTGAVQTDKRNSGRDEDNYYRNETKTRENFNQSTMTHDTINKHTDETEKTKNKMSFYIKDKNMENNIVVRINEYSCCYVQVMEEFINTVLEKMIFVKHFVPCFFHEGLNCLTEFCLDVNIKHVIHKLLSLWKKEDNFKKDINPNDFMCLLEYGWLLIDLMKDSIPDTFQEIYYLYSKLLENIENPVVEDIEFIRTPIWGYQDNINRSKFVKDKFEIVNYLKKHFSEWEDFELDEEERDLKNDNNDNKIQILRTCGKYLKSFKIDNKKHISFCINSENESTLNKNDSKTNETEEKFMRNTKMMEEHEGNIKKSDLCLEPNESSLTIVNNEVNDRLMVLSLSDDVNLVNDIEINDRLINDDKLIYDNEINDGYNGAKNSGCETEMHTSSFLQDFFVNLSCTLKDIFSYVDKCNNDLRDETIKEKDRECMFERATQICDHMNHIIDKLNSIIERESKEDSKLKFLLIKTGQNVSEDKRIAKYRQTAQKCLEQTLILSSCLKLILSTNKQNTTDDVSITSYNGTSFNSFE